MKNIAVDIGNTRIKWALFDGIHPPEIQYLDPDKLTDYQWPIHDRMIISTVRSEKQIPGWLSSNHILTLTHLTPIPIVLDYKTPNTLGLDRIAAAVGAYDLFPNNTCLIIDMGTCITYDLLTHDGIFHGGAIAPGLDMRLKAMHAFTGKLPNITNPPDLQIYPGKSTQESMLAGVHQGILHELTGYISLLQKEFENLRVILTGGDVSFFESSIKAPIFVRPELNLSGLNRILLHNESKA